MVERLRFSDLSEAGAATPKVCDVLEAGGLVEFPQMGFATTAEERELLDIKVVSPKSKNVSLGPGGGVRGAELDPDGEARMAAMLGRFASFAEQVIHTLLPGYGERLTTRRTSFRPGAVETRVLSPRRDDRRLHVDAFPANPTGGQRILRVFSNIHPDGVARVWQVGELDFERFAQPYVHRLSGGPSLPAAWAMAQLRLTRGRRTRYDQAMLELHDLAKLDETFQAETPRTTIAFAAGSTWVVFSDSVLHAALAGQHLLEQTFLVPPEAMAAPERSPLAILTRLTGRRLT